MKSISLTLVSIAFLGALDSQAASNVLPIPSAKLKPSTTGLQVAQARRSGLQTIVKVPKSSEAEKPWNLGLNVSHFQGLTKKDEASYSQGNDYLVSGGYKFQNKTALAFEMGYTESLKDRSESTASDLIITGSKSFSPDWGTADYKIGAKNVFPASKDSLEKADLLYKLILYGKILSKPETFLWGHADIEAAVSVGRSFHEFKTNVDGKSLFQYTSNQSLKTTFKYLKASLALGVLHRFLYDYNGNQTTRFGHYQELGVDITKNVSLFVGHDMASVNGIPLTTPEGKSNFQFTTDDDSMVYVGMNFSI